MRLNKFKNAKRNSIWGIFNKLIMMLFPFIIRTIIIKKLGAEYLGLSGLFSSILNLLNLTELGVGSAIVFSMYKPLAEGNNKKISELLNFYKWIYRIIGIFVLMIGLALLPFLNFLISGDIPSNINIYILYIIYLGNSLLTYWFLAYKNCLLQVHQRTDIISKVYLITNLIMYILQIIILTYLKNYYLYVLMIPIISIIRNVLNAFFVNKMFPEFKCEGNISNEEKKQIRKKIMGMFMTKIASTSRNALDSIVISAFLGLKAVTIYNNYYYITNSVSAFLVILATSISAGVGNSIVLDTKEKNLTDMRKANFIYLLISGFCFSIMVSIFQPFIKLWVGDDFLVKDSAMLLFSIYFLVEKSINIIGQYYDANGLWWRGKWKGIIESIANLLLNILLCYWFGIPGVISATIISIIIIGFPFTAHYLFKEYYNYSEKEFVIRQYIYIILLLIVGIVSYCICKLIPFGNGRIEIFSLILLRLIICGLTFACLVYVLFHKFEDYKMSINWIKSKINNIK